MGANIIIQTLAEKLSVDSCIKCWDNKEKLMENEVLYESCYL